MSRCLKSISTNLSLRCYSSSSSSSKANKYAERMIPKRILKASEQTPNFESKEKIEQISEAVQKYLKNYKSNTEFFKKRNEEFELGKRHLANIMGWDEKVDINDQEQIDNAIAYLFPSGLFHHAVRPVMLPPSKIYPKFKTAQYDRTGRPFSSFFYTKWPNYFQSLYDLYINYEDLNRFEDSNIAKGIQPTENDKFDVLKHIIMSKKQLEDRFVEKLKDEHYDNFVNHLNKLIDHPYSALKSNFINKFTLSKEGEKWERKLFELGTDDKGEVFSYSVARRKELDGKICVYKNGSGKFLINDKYDMNHFTYFLAREQILTPLVTADLVDKVDIYVYFNPIDQPISNKDQTRQAGVIRLGIAQAICAFVDPEVRELLRLNGLLQWDWRYKERKKPGLHKARKAPVWRKR